MKRITDINVVYDLYLITDNALIVLDIDGVVLSNKYGKILTDINVKKLINNDTVFLTSRILKEYTNRQLNDALNTDADYNIICSSNDSITGESTKGNVFINYIGLYKDKHIIYVDDILENLESVKKSLESVNHTNYSLFLYKE